MLDVQKIMEQVQVFASTYSLVGGRFDDGSRMEQSNEEKFEIEAMLCAASDYIESMHAALHALLIQALQSELNTPAHEWGWEAIGMARDVLTHTQPEPTRGQSDDA